LVIEHGTKALATWAILLLSSLLVALLAYRMAPAEPWTFVVDIPQAPVRGDVQLRREVITPPGEPDFVHGPSLIATSGGGLVAFWYRAVYEGAAHAQLVSSRFDGTRWSPTSVVTNSGTVSRDIGLTIKSLANPVPFRRSANEIWLFFAASRLSGWATCEILLMRSSDNGATWGPAERLYASPFLNMSQLTKSVPVRLSGGRIGLPAYYEMNRKYPVLFILDSEGRVIDRRRMGNGGKVGYQPTIVATSPTTAVAFVRRLKNSRPFRILVSRTSDAGLTWTKPAPIDLPNPGGPIDALRYDNSRILLAFNDDATIERNIRFAFTDLNATHVQRIGTVAEMRSDLAGDAVMYPYLIESEPGQFDIVYSRPLKSINHVRISSAWIEHSLQTSTAQK
jgi:predicted neuraminidase